MPPRREDPKLTLSVTCTPKAEERPNTDRRTAAMPPKKKGKKGKKKGKEVVPITDPEMLRVIGCPLEGTQLNLRMYYRELGHPISIALKLTDLATVSDMVSEFNTITNAPPGTNYVFVGKLRKSHQSTIMLNFDGHLNLKDQLGVQDKDDKHKENSGGGSGSLGSR